MGSLLSPIVGDQRGILNSSACGTEVDPAYATNLTIHEPTDMQITLNVRKHII